MSIPGDVVSRRIKKKREKSFTEVFSLSVEKRFEIVLDLLFFTFFNNRIEIEEKERLLRP